MDDLKSLEILPFLDNKYYQIHSEVKAYVENVLKWANELEEMVGSGVLEKKQISTFLLPKTPSEKKTRINRKKSRMVSKVPDFSIADSTTSGNVSCLDTTISSRTRAARKVLSPKLSQLNTTCDKREVLELEVANKTIKIENKNLSLISSETFILSQAKTRTKPVVHKTKQKNGDAGLQTSFQRSSSYKTSEILNDITDDQSNERKLSRYGSQSPAERRKNLETNNEVLDRKSKSIFSRTLSESPVRRITRNASEVVNSSRNERNSRKDSLKVSSSSPINGPARKKISRALSESPIQRPSKLSKTFSKISNEEIINNESTKVYRKNSDSNVRATYALRTPNRDSIESSSKIVASETFGNNNVVRKTSKISSSGNKKSNKSKTSGDKSKISGKETKKLTSKKLSKLVCKNSLDNQEKSNSLVSDNDKTLLLDDKLNDFDKSRHQFSTKIIEASFDINESEKSSDEIDLPQKKRAKRETENSNLSTTFTEYESVRITRTKSKAIKEMLKENSQEIRRSQDATVLAKKLVNKAKMISLKKNHIIPLSENQSTPKSISNILITNLTTEVWETKPNNQLLSSNKYHKTPLATLPNSTVKKTKTSGYKDKLKIKGIRRDSSVENLIRSANKKIKTAESDTKLEAKKNKEDEAAKKRQKVIKKKQEELKKKNELKHQLAMKQREKLEQEKYNNMILIEKEKEERHKLILQERQIKLKEEVLKKKMLTQQKIAETVERRRLEEEARIAKLKEMEAEEERMALEKQRELERQEKRAQERLAQKKAMELQIKQELENERLKAEKLGSAKKFLPSASKMQSASKKQRFGLLGEKKEWDYKARNENDFGLDDEESEFESDDEKPCNVIRPVPAWSKNVQNGLAPSIRGLTLEMLSEYMSCYQKTPDINKMFNMTPTKRIKRTSSAIWNTPTP